MVGMPGKDEGLRTALGSKGCAGDVYLLGGIGSCWIRFCLQVSYNVLWGPLIQDQR